MFAQRTWRVVLERRVPPLRAAAKRKGRLDGMGLSDGARGP